MLPFVGAMLRVWSVSGDELASASREECRLVRDVKEHLRTRYGVPVCLQQLLCDGRCLADDVEAPADLQLVPGYHNKKTIENHIIYYRSRLG